MLDILSILPYVETYTAEQINMIPPQYGLVTKNLNLFPRIGMPSRNLEMRYDNYQIMVLGMVGLGGPAQLLEERTGKEVIVGIPHFPLLDLIRPSDIQDWNVVIGEQKQVNTVSLELDKRLMNIRWNFDITWEWLCTQALQGVIKDGNGNLVYDLYALFNVAKTTIDFDLGTPTSDINGHCDAVWKSITTNLTQDSMSGVEAIVDPVFFGKLVSHPSVKQFYVNAEQALQLVNMNRRRGDRDSQMWGREIQIFNIHFMEYYGQASIKTAGTRVNTPFWQPSTGTAYPAGSQTLFRTFDAPADDMRYVNTRGQPIYISPRILEHGKGIELLSQSNTLPMVRRPAALVQLTSST